MSLILQGSTSGSVTLQEPAVAGTTVLDLPATSGNVVVDSATQTLTNKTLTSPTIGGTPTGVGVLTSGTAVASTSGTSIDFTSIPSWVKRITVMFNGVSTNGTSIVQIQLGDAGGIETSGYTGMTARFAAANNVYTVAYTSGILTQTGMQAGVSYVAQIVFTLVGSNAWVASGAITSATTNDNCQICGSKTLSDTLTQLRITTVNGTDTFDAGTINILYE